MNQKKKFKIKQNEILELTFEELYDRFYDLIDRESKRIYKKYNRSFSLNEIKQRFTIELWKNFKRYDYNKDGLINSYVHPRLIAAERAMVNKNKETKKAKIKNSFLQIENFENEQINGYEIENPEQQLMKKELIKKIVKKYKTEEEKDLILILLDKKNFSVQDYAKKYNITKPWVYNRLNKIKDELKEEFKNEYR